MEKHPPSPYKGVGWGEMRRESVVFVFLKTADNAPPCNISLSFRIILDRVEGLRNKPDLGAEPRGIWAGFLEDESAPPTDLSDCPLTPTQASW